ncbi:hypothetical protein L596_009927 [Steinernema carpocapsae]|uniref:Uncharacterized protein n=1 Tax=Steinernema carpocapsae TaxID=34508 RepID=A0A4U5PGR6_STECR|nr:hypothetical protein L596_009927 [Steinernema carpocapsae]
MPWIIAFYALDNSSSDNEELQLLAPLTPLRLEEEAGPRHGPRTPSGSPPASSAKFQEEAPREVLDFLLNSIEEDEEDEAVKRRQQQVEKKPEEARARRVAQPIQLGVLGPRHGPRTPSGSPPASSAEFQEEAPREVLDFLLNSIEEDEEDEAVERRQQQVEKKPEEARARRVAQPIQIIRPDPSVRPDRVNQANVNKGLRKRQEDALAYLSRVPRWLPRTTANLFYVEGWEFLKPEERWELIYSLGSYSRKIGPQIRDRPPQTKRPEKDLADVEQVLREKHGGY